MPDAAVIESQIDDIAELDTELEPSGAVEDLSPESMPEPERPPVAEAQPAEAVKPVEFSPDLIALAGRYNISPQDARAAGSPEALRASLRYIDKLQARHQEAEAAKQQPEKEKPVFKYKIELPPEVAEAVDPRFLQSIQGMNDHYAQMIEKMHERAEAAERTLSESQAKEQAREARQFTRTADKFFSSLGPEGETLFGKGDAYKVQADSPEMFEHRVRTIRMFEALSGNPDFVERHNNDIESMLKAAYRAEFAEHAEQIAQQQVAAKVVKRSGQIVGKPGRKVEPAAVGSAAAERQVIARWARENNVPLDESQDFSEL